MKLLSLFLISGSLLWTGAAACDDAPRRYLVEVIVFKNLGPDSSDGELWHVHEFDLPETRPPAPVLPAEPMPAMEQAGQPESPVEYTVLEHLARTLDIMQADPRYQVLTYRAWTQPLTDRPAAPEVRLDAPSSLTGTAASPEAFYGARPLEGWVRVFENRLLFVEADVIARMTPTNMQPRVEVYSTREQAQSHSGWESMPESFRIQEKRRVKLNELHYFDHPFFGLLVRVSRVEPQPPAVIN